MCDVTHSQSILSSIGIQQSLDGWLVHTCDMTHEFMCLTWLFRVCDIICVTRRIHVCDITRSCVRQEDMCDVTHSHVWRVEFVCVIWCTHMFHMTHLHVRHDSFIQPIHVCDMTHSCVWHDSFICVTWRTHLRDTTHLHVWLDSCSECGIDHRNAAVVWRFSSYLATRPPFRFGCVNVCIGM